MCLGQYACLISYESHPINEWVWEYVWDKWIEGRPGWMKWELLCKLIIKEDLTSSKSGIDYAYD